MCVRVRNMLLTYFLHFGAFFFYLMFCAKPRFVWNIIRFARCVSVLTKITVEDGFLLILRLNVLFIACLTELQLTR